MKSLSLLSAFVILSVPAYSFVVPGAYSSSEGDHNYFLMNTFNEALTYQFLMDDSILGGLAGQQVTGIRFRLDGSQGSWLANDFTLPDFEVRMAAGVEVADISNTFANNFASSAMQVRDGQWTIPAGSFPSTGSPHGFGPEVSFDSPYVYTGGNLLIDMRLVINPQPDTQLILDAVHVNGGPANGYGVGFAARHSGIPNATSGTQANFIVADLITAPVPEPMTLLTLGSLTALLVRKRNRKR